MGKWHQSRIFIISVIISLKMGSICSYKEEGNPLAKNENEPEREVITINDTDSNNQIKFQITTDKLIHVTADLLVLFMDKTINIKRSDHFLKLPLQGTKLQQHMNAFMEKHKLSGDSFLTFNIIIPTLNFGKVSIVFCEAWREEENNKQKFRQTLKGYFDSIAGQNYKNIAITQFTSELGVHLQKGARCLMSELIRLENKPQVVQFCCVNEQSKAVFSEIVNSSREDLLNSFASTQQSRPQSDYF